ncbi:hypothetical protein D3C86_1291480 [compost metagenome]
MHNTLKKISLAAVVGFVVSAFAAPAHAGNMFGIGYKAGNGLGFAGGDLIVRPLPNLGIDLQGNTYGDGTFSGFGVAPAITFHMSEDGGPYVGAGVTYMSLGGKSTSGVDVTGTGLGYFGNVGYEFRPLSSLGLMAGVGYSVVPGVTLSGNGQSETTSGISGLNLELGARLYF